jgi:hypothetical protein
MLLLVQGVRGVFEGLCGVYEETDEFDTPTHHGPCFRFLGRFDGFSDWILSLSPTHQNWVVGRARDRASGAGWIVSARLSAHENLGVFGDPALCTDWRVFDVSVGWTNEPELQVTRLRYIPSRQLSNVEAAAVKLQAQLAHAQCELVEAETDLMKLRTEVDAKQTQLEMQYERQKHLKQALEMHRGSDQLAAETAACVPGSVAPICVLLVRRACSRFLCCSHAIVCARGGHSGA